MNEKYLKKETEENLDYAMRLIEIKKEEKPEDLDWSDIVDLLGLDLNRDSLRKSQDTCYGGLAVYKEMKKRQINESPKEYQAEISNQIQELKKERMKISDERAALNRKLRLEARAEDFYDLVNKCVDKISKEKSLLPIREFENNTFDRVGILTLSDFHFGLNIDEFNNKYNEKIFRDRISKLIYKTIEYVSLNVVENLVILGLGDYISGLIHNSIRIENKETVIEQVIKVSEMLVELIDKLSEHCRIYYYDVSDNHGRVIPNKEDCANNENFSLFIKWYLKARFKDKSYIEILDNDINEEIGTIEILGKKYCFTHGHRDKIGDVVQNLSLMTKQFYDGIFIAHSHHFEASEVHGTYIYMNGTLSGTDTYANNLRKTSNPSQNLFIVNEDGIECQYLIRL